MTEQLDLFEMTESAEEYKLLPRQWELYRLIRDNSYMGRKTTQKEICDTIPDYIWNDEPSSHDHCTMVWSDIKEINLSPRLEKLIISKNFEYWIGTKEETEEFIDDLWKALAPRLFRYWHYKRKIAADGQGKLLGDDLNPIDEDSKARTYIESFIKKEEPKKDE